VSSQEFSRLLTEVYPEIEATAHGQIVKFRELVCAENEKQNLTRLLEPVDFLDGHVVDSVELLKSKQVTFPALDLGSGAGVPGMICAILEPKAQWILVDSEKMKATFMVAAAEALGLSNVRVAPERAEDMLRVESIESVVARAVGPVERIYAWLRPRSTWNNLVLLKGPSWPDEWSQFQRGPWKKELVISETHDYVVSKALKKRKIILLTRTGGVPRGTKR